MNQRLANALMAFIIFIHYDTIKDWHRQLQTLLESTGLTDQYAYLGATGGIALTIGVLWALINKIEKQFS